MNLAKSILISLAVIFSPPTIAVEQPVRVAGDPYPPWAEGEAGEQSTKGIAVDIVEELFARLNRETLVNIYPFKRGIDRIKHGEEDIILMVSESEERKAFMLFTSPIRHVEFVLFTPVGKETFAWKGWADLAKYNIGVVTGQNMGDDWKNAIDIHGLKVEETQSDIFNIEKLLRGRVDMIAADREVLERIIEKNPKYQDLLAANDKPIYVSMNNLGISKKSPLASELLEINATLQGMKDDGTFQKIFCVYNKSYSGNCEIN
ncbi:substrate-binding periplasmic protein [Amphritea sp. HPY]|uniref:substrate-binding periplasmic protein n=1 Tax=Amphritea sp. HPY TaxID=3421652 RepID=UPI003D7E9AF3